MKTKLLFLLSLCTVLGHTQTSIEQLHSPNGSQYSVMSGTIDQSSSGANASWDFTNLVATTDVLVDTYTDNIGTSFIETSQNTTLIGRIDLETILEEVAITASLSQGIQANYTNSGIIGKFPLNYEYSNNDVIEGTFNGLGQSGTILNTSTIDVNVDAWGNLKIGSFDAEVTRLQIVQNLDLSVPNPVSPILGNIEFEATITSHLYYDANSNDLVFRYSRVQSSPPVVDPIDIVVLESMSTYILSNKDFESVNSKLRLTNNPVKNSLKFKGNVDIYKVLVYDISGKLLLNFDERQKKTFDISFLKSGLYIVQITTDTGSVVRKFIKE